jgi:hypothetical protein
VTRILLVAQETGGVGKSMPARGIAEAIPDAPIIESTQRVREYDHGKTKGSKLHSTILPCPRSAEIGTTFEHGTIESSLAPHK